MGNVKHLFIINPVAGKNNDIDKLKASIEQLELLDYNIEVTSAPAEAEKIARRYCENTDKELRIYACGGDGTFNEVINGAYGFEKCSVGVIPIGSGNDFVKSFPNYSKQDFLDLEKMSGGESITIDALSVNDRISVNILSAGYDAAVVKHMTRFKNKPLVSGKMAYKLSLVYCLGREMKHTFKLYADDVEVGDESNDYLFAIAANGEWYGGGFKAAPNADLQDGLIDFIRIPTVSRFLFLRVVNIFKKGEHLKKLSFVKHMHCKKLKITADRLIDMNIDGEIVPMKDPVITIIPNSVRIILPCVTNGEQRQEKTTLAQQA